VAILGRAKRGKSSLINSIVEQRARYCERIAGTTRDAVDVLYERGGRPYVFHRHGGITAEGKHQLPLDRSVQMRAERSIRRATFAF